jgi:predicted nuclease with TOPRIM domain
VHDAELKNDFLKISAVLRLFPKIIPQAENQIEDLKDALRQVENENYALKTRFDLMQKDFHELKKSVDGLYLMNVQYPMTLERTVFNKKTNKMESWTETINTPEEFAEANKKFQDRVKKVSRDRS